MTTPRVIGKTESQSLESPLLGNGYGGFGEGREEPAANLWVYTERPNGDSAPTSKRNRALRLLCSLLLSRGSPVWGIEPRSVRSPVDCSVGTTPRQPPSWRRFLSSRQSPMRATR